MGMGARAKTERIRVVVSDDRLQAWLKLPGPASPGSLPPSESVVLAALAESGIQVTDAVRERVARYAGIIDRGTGGPPEIAERFLIAEGQPPVDARDGDFAWDEIFNRRVQDWRGDAPVDYYTANSILTVEAETVVGRIRPPTSGRDGRDVFGKDLLPNRRIGMPLKLGNGLRVASNDPLQVVTTVAGRLIRQRQTLHVAELLDIRGNVDFRSGSIDSVIDVHVAGDIKPKFAVKTTKSLTVWGSVEAARLAVGEDIQVRGGLYGQESGCRIEAGGAVVAGICDGVEVEARGDIRVAKEIINCQLRTTGQLLIEYGSVIGGEVYARDGVRARQVGSDAGVPTRIAVGVDGAVLYRARKIDEQIKKRAQRIERDRAQVQALAANPVRPTSAQREQAAELLAKAKKAERVASDLAAQRDQMLNQAAPVKAPAIHIEGTLYPGVVLVFGLREARIEAPVRGPLCVEERRSGRATEIALVHRSTGSVTPLPSAAVDVERFEKS